MDSIKQKVVQPTETLPFEIDYLPQFFREKAERELNETPENRVNLLQELKDMVEEDETLKVINFNTDLLQQFLRVSKYNVSRAVSRLQVNIKFKSKNINFFKDVLIEELSTNSPYKFGSPMPFRCPDGCTMIMFNNGQWSPANLSFVDMIRLQVIIYEQSLRNPMSQINGYKIIADFKNTSLRHLQYATPQKLFVIYKAFLDCIPLRFKGIHFVNPSAAMGVVWTFFKPLLSEKLRNRIFIHSHPENLLDYFPRNLIPVQYGGDLQDYYMEDWMKFANDQQSEMTVGGQANFF